jgi:ABC-2 type transport system ATP-binding protein
MDSQVIVRDLSKSYGKNPAVRRVTFQISAGEVVGLVGPNGAGKTTLLMLLAGYLRADSGEIIVGGVRVKSGMTSKSTVFVPDIPVFYGFQTAREYLSMVAQMWQADITATAIEDALSKVNLLADCHKNISDLSRGMTQRLGWAHVMITRPKLILLDEPTSALDPTGIAALRSIVADLKQRGSAIVFSSHSLSEVERVCDRVLFLNSGDCSELTDKATLQNSSLFVIQVHPASKDKVVNLSSFASDIQQDGVYVRFAVDGKLSFHEISALLLEAEIQVVTLSEQSQSLETAFEQKMRGSQ